MLVLFRFPVAATAEGRSGGETERGGRCEEEAGPRGEGEEGAGAFESAAAAGGSGEDATADGTRRRASPDGAGQVSRIQAVAEADGGREDGSGGGNTKIQLQLTEV